jgi:hypothetical protein
LLFLRNSNNSQKPGGKDQGKGRGKVKNNTNDYDDSDKQQNNQQKKSPPLSEEEQKRLEEERLKREEEAREEESRKAEAKKQQEEEKAAEAAAKARAKKQDEADQSLKDAIATLRAVVEAVQHHQTLRALMAEESIKAARKLFETNKKSLKTDEKNAQPLSRKLRVVLPGQLNRMMLSKTLPPSILVDMWKKLSPQLSMPNLKLPIFQSLWL